MLRRASIGCVGLGRRRAMRVDQRRCISVSAPRSSSVPKRCEHRANACNPFLQPDGGAGGGGTHAPLLLQNPLEPYDHMEFNTRRYARAMVLQNDARRASSMSAPPPLLRDDPRPREAGIDHDDDGKDLEFNTVCPGMVPSLPPNGDNDDAAVGSSSTVSGGTSTTNNPQRAAQHSNGATDTPAPSMSMSWSCHVCGACHDAAAGGMGFTRTVCPVCLSRRTPPHPSDAAWRANPNNWVCGACHEVNFCSSSSATGGGSAAAVTRWSPTASAAASLENAAMDADASGAGGDDDEDMGLLPTAHNERADRCRCCGDVPPLSDAKNNGTAVADRCQQEQRPMVRNDYAASASLTTAATAAGNSSRRQSNDAAAAAFAIFRNPRMDTNVGDIFRVQDVLQRWRCIECSLSLKNTVRVCPRCHTDRLDTQVSCPTCRFNVGLTTRDVMEQRRCPQCANWLHGATVNNFPVMWVCTCGATAKTPLCPRCRAPKRLPDGAADARRFMATWDFALASNWCCASCSHINTAAVKRLASRRGEAMRMEVVNGQHACGACHEQWHNVIVNGGSQWRCACQRLNPIGLSRCLGCHREVSNLTCATNSFWVSGDWVCPVCARHNFRLKSVCTCGSSQPK